MKEHKKHNVFVNGPISPNFIADSIAKHSTKTTIGAHDIFLGQVRSDVIENKIVQSIEYTTYEEMAEEKFHEIREAAFDKFELTCMHIYHSIGNVKAGEICLFVFVSSKHRAQAFEACRYIVEEIKSHVPIWGKEIFEDQTFAWKGNI
ncbi:MAG: molybdenum cofactor biosynthesis protein MoaE [Bacteroidia bacterium]|nr:molybdenum cofactor biosynthesis protein MoaE [Bacteroidia bacterium]